ncbi:MAG: hypothetical protein J2P37_02275 [Ktedonobacteraceae bacterium]|nr:hypothetical protein [Ktedonobacteraceae bacterium]MBO0792097.1 hypothetical protein [Ktedonobacteraceae bacterium]
MKERQWETVPGVMLLKGSGTLDKWEVRVRKVLSIVAFWVSGCVVMLLVSACQGIDGLNMLGNPSTSTVNGNTNMYISGTIQSVNVREHSAILVVNGQRLTVSGLTDEQVSVMGANQGRSLTLQVRQVGVDSYTVATGGAAEIDPTATPAVASASTDGAASVAGSIEYVGTVLSADSDNVTVRMPDGQGLPMRVIRGQDGFHRSWPAVGQVVRVKTIAMSDGTFQATQLQLADSDDVRNQDIVKYRGLLNSVSGSDKMYSIRVGKKEFRFPLDLEVDLDFFHMRIVPKLNNVMVKAEVVFDGDAASIVKVETVNH